MDNNNEDVGNSSPSSTDPDAEQVWATSSLNEASHGNSSPHEVGESLQDDGVRPGSSGFMDDADPGAYSDDALPQPSGAYGCREAGVADASVIDASVVGMSAYEDEASAELPSTTTADRDELTAGMGLSTSSDGPPGSDEEIYAQEQPSTSSTSMQSVQYVVGSYSPQQPASSTAGYDVAMEDYERASPSVTAERQPVNECYEEQDYSDMAFPVSSSHVTSPMSHAEPGPSQNHDKGESDLYNMAVSATHSLHPPIPQEQQTANDASHRRNHCLPSPSGQDDCPSGSGIPGNPDVEPLAASFVRIVGQRFSVIDLPHDASGPPPLTPQKENLVDSVIRTVIGCSSSSSSCNLADGGMLMEDHHHHSRSEIKDEVSSVVDDDDGGHGHYMVSDPMLNVGASTSAETTVTDSMSTSELVTVSNNVVVTHMAHVDGNILIGHLASSSVACHAPDDTMAVAVSSDDCAPLQVQVSHIGNASHIHGYVSSSTGADGLGSLSDRAIILDGTVDSTVGSDCQVVGSSDGHYTLDVEHRMITVSSLDDDYSNDVESGSVVMVSSDPDASAVLTGDVVHTSQQHLIGQNNRRDVNSTSIVIGRSEEDVVHILSAGTSEFMLAANSVIADDFAATSSTSRSHRASQENKAPDECSDGLWCEECHQCYEDGCPKHQVQTIYDKPVLSRAWASLPATYLSIGKTDQTVNGEPVFGVLAKKTIPKRTQFGPVEGVVYVQQNDDETVSPKMDENAPILQIETNDGQMMLVDTTDESVSNWMRFVRLAHTPAEQNLVIVQLNEALYFTTTSDIPPRTELKVHYSEQYGSRRGLALLEAKEKEVPNRWPCFECNQHFQTSEDLQLHLNDHETVEVESVGGQLVGSELPRQNAKGIKRKKSSGGVSAKKKSKDTRAQQIKKEGASEDANLVGGLQSEQVYPLAQKRRQLGEWMCTQCNLAFNNDNTRNLHILTHAAMDVAGIEDQVSVSGEVVQVDCSNLLNVATVLNENQDVVSNLTIAELHSCPECNVEFSSRRELIEHAGTHGKIFFRCYLPKELTLAGSNRGGKKGGSRARKNGGGRSASNLNGEKASVRVGNGVAGSGGLAKVRRSFRGLVNPAKPHKCEMCYKSFATEDRLQRHMLVHGNEDAKPLQCHVCGKRFLNNSALACHVKVHSDERKFYECPICKEDFDHIVILKKHVQVHCIDGLFTCPSCQKVFDEYNQIRKHIRAFHSEKKFPCEHCEKIFPRPDKLKLHMLRHSNHREFLCANCGKQFKRKDKLKEHMKRMHSIEREHRIAMRHKRPPSSKKFIPKVLPTDYHRFIYKCHACLLGFKRRGMLVNHLAKRHPDIRPHTVPELNLPILKTTRDYYCQYCEKVYKSSSKRKAHILKQHPGAELPMSNRRKGGIPEIPGLPNPTFSQTVGSITTHPHNCEWCHKQYASKAKLLQHQRKKHYDLLPVSQQTPRHQNREPSSTSQQPSRQNVGSAQYFAVQETIARLLQQQSPSDEMVEEENLTVEEHDVQQQPQQQQLLSTQTQTSNLEYNDVHMADGGDVKATLQVVSGPSGGVYVGGRSHVITSMDVSEVQMDNLPHADLLTQAMCELTQPLADYGHVIVSDNGIVVHEIYDHARICNSCPPSTIAVSTAGGESSTSSLAPALQSSSPTTNAAGEATAKEESRSQLGPLLSHYDVTVDGSGEQSVIILAEAEALDVQEGGRVTVNAAESTAGEETTTTTEAEFVHRTWTSTYTSFSANS